MERSREALRRQACEGSREARRGQACERSREGQGQAAEAGKSGKGKVLGRIRTPPELKTPPADSPADDQTSEEKTPKRSGKPRPLLPQAYSKQTAMAGLEAWSRKSKAQNVAILTENRALSVPQMEGGRRVAGSARANRIGLQSLS